MMSVDERRSLVWANLTSGNIFHMHIIQYSQFARVDNDKIVVCDTLCRMVIAALESFAQLTNYFDHNFRTSFTSTQGANNIKA